MTQKPNTTVHLDDRHESIGFDSYDPAEDTQLLDAITRLFAAVEAGTVVLSAAEEKLALAVYCSAKRPPRADRDAVLALCSRAR